MKRGADGAVLQPAASGCYVALVEPDERQFNVLLERRNFDFDHYISTGTALVNGAQLPPDGKDAAHAPGAKRFAEVCANKCRFLKLSDDLTRLEVSLEQQASDLDVEVTPELAKVFGEVRGFFEDSINFHSLHRSRARSHAQRAESRQPGARESGATSRDAECVPDEAAFADFDSGSAGNGGPVKEKDITISAVEKDDDGVVGDAGGGPDIEPLGPTTPTKPRKSLGDMLGAESRPKRHGRPVRRRTLPHTGGIWTRRRSQRNKCHRMALRTKTSPAKMISRCWFARTPSLQGIWSLRLTRMAKSLGSWRRTSQSPTTSKVAVIRASSLT